MNFGFQSLFAIWSSLSQRLHYYVYLSTDSWQYQKYWTILILVLCLLCVTPLVCSFYSSFAPCSLFSTPDYKGIVSYLHMHLFSKVLHRRCRVSSRRPMYLLIVGSDYCVMCFAYALHMHRQNHKSCPSFMLVHWAFRACYRNCLPLLHHGTPSCHKINLFKHPFRGSRLQDLDDILCCSLASSPFTPRKFSLLSDYRLNSRMCSVRWFLLITMPAGLRFQKQFS